MPSFNKAIKINPDFFEAYNNLGMTKLKQGDKVRAVNYFHRALQINPGYHVARKNLEKVLLDNN